MATAVDDRIDARLSPDRERALVSVAASGDQAARDQAVEIFTPLIGSVARRYCRVPGVERAELMQEGVAGLLETMRRYDVELGTPF
jgi:DNA-directed RNA polymerase specialized sigma subunit